MLLSRPLRDRSIPPRAQRFSRQSHARCLALSLLVLLAACYTARLPSGFTFGPVGVPDEQPIDRVLWIEPVQIKADIPDRELVSVAYTYNLARYLKDREMFKRVKTRPGVVAAEDWVARVSIDHYVQSHYVSFFGIQLNLFNLGFFDFVTKDGELRMEMDVALEIRDGKGQLVGTGSVSHRGELPVSRSKPTQGVDYFLDERSRLTDELFDAAVKSGAAVVP